MKTITTLLILLLYKNCHSQEKSVILSDEDYEIINVVFNKSLEPFYLDKNYKYKTYPKKFTNNYLLQQKLYKTTDSICNNSKDILELKTFCPLADSFKDYKNLFSIDDFKYLETNYSTINGINQIINFGKIESPMVVKHSDLFYNTKGVQRHVNEFPTISIYGIYYTENRQRAIIYYLKKLTHEGEGSLEYLTLKKKKNIWWKPLDKLKF